MGLNPEEKEPRWFFEKLIRNNTCFENIVHVIFFTGKGGRQTELEKRGENITYV